MSDRYRMVPTIGVVDMLRDRGFLPVRAEQSRTRIPGKGDFTRHLVRFRHADHFGPLTVGAEIPEVVLVNSHDGTSAYRFMAGIFRLVCSNGMVVQSADRGSISVRHSGAADLRERVIDATFQIMDEAPRTLEKIGAWKQVELSTPQRAGFAAAALELKDSRTVTPAQLLAPRRAEDRASDLWTTASVVQEHLIRGGDRGRSESGRRSTTRPVKTSGSTGPFRRSPSGWRNSCPDQPWRRCEPPAPPFDPRAPRVLRGASLALPHPIPSRRPTDERHPFRPRPHQAHRPRRGRRDAPRQGGRGLRTRDRPHRGRL
jgi:hypothetical protein